MMKIDPKKIMGSNYFLILSLGLLIGFVIGFVVLLSRLPVNDQFIGNNYQRNSSSNYSLGKSDFDFYNVLTRNRVEVDEYNEPVYRSVKRQAKPAVVETLAVNTQAMPEPVPMLVIPASYKRSAYYLQAGSFSRQGDAEKMRARLLLNGLDAFVKPYPTEGMTYHRVRIGPYYDNNKLNNAQKQLKNRGIQYLVLQGNG